MTTIEGSKKRQGLYEGVARGYERVSDQKSKVEEQEINNQIEKLSTGHKNTGFEKGGEMAKLEKMKGLMRAENAQDAKMQGLPWEEKAIKEEETAVHKTRA